MEQLTSTDHAHLANLKFLEVQGLYSDSANTWANTAAENHMAVLSNVMAPLELWHSFVNTVGFDNVRCLLNTVFGEINALQNHWSLTSYYRAIGSGTYSINDALDLFNELEDGHRKQGAVDYVRRFKEVHGQSVDVTFNALGCYASLLVATSSFVTNLMTQLDAFNNGYYSKLCEVTIGSMNPDSLVLSFSRRTGIIPFISVRPLEVELGLICSGNLALLRQAKGINAARQTVTMQKPADTWLHSTLTVHSLLKKFTLNG